MRRGGGAAVVTLALILLPTATAETALGNLSLKGPLLLPEATRTEGSLLAALALGAITDARLTATHLDVTIYEQDFLIAGETEIALPAKPRVFSLTEAVIQQTAPSSEFAFAGVHPNEGAVIELFAENQTSARSSAYSFIETGSTVDTPNKAWYGRESHGPQVLIDATSSMRACGPAAFKLLGFDLTIQGKENATAETIQTGRFQSDPLRGRYVWIYAETESGCLDLGPGGTLKAAVKAAFLTWDGRAIFVPTTGEIHSDASTYSPAGRQAYLDGAFTGHMAPSLDGRTASLRVEGDMRGTDLASVPVPQPSFVPGGALTWVFVVGAAVCAAGGAVAWQRFTPRREERFDSLMNKAGLAMEIGKYDAAVEALRKLHRMAPKSPQVAEDLAGALAASGREEEALDVLAEAHELSKDGSAALEHARLLEVIGRPTGEVLEWISHALGRTPGFVKEIGPGTFPRLKNSPDLRALLDVAVARLARDQHDRNAPH